MMQYDATPNWDLPVAAGPAHPRQGAREEREGMEAQRIGADFSQHKRQSQNANLTNLGRIAQQLKSFSVIYLVMIGFTIMPNEGTVYCSKCSLRYTIQQMEENNDEELNRRHEAANSNCPIYNNLKENYGGALRMPCRRQTGRAGPQALPGVELHSSVQPRTANKDALQARGGGADVISDTFPGQLFTGGLHQDGASAGLYADYESRVNSYSQSWRTRAKKRSRPNPEDLAACGLYEYTETRKDAVKCFSCDVVLCGWKTDENIWVKHALQSPSCAFVREKKGEKFVMDLMDKIGPQNQPTLERPSATAQDVERVGVPLAWISTFTDMGFGLDDILLISLWKKNLVPSESPPFKDIQEALGWLLSRKDDAEENFAVIAQQWPGLEGSAPPDTAPGDAEQEAGQEATTEENQTCKICFSKPAHMLLRPCSHMVSCDACTRRLRLCPICRVPITAVIQVTL